MKLSYRALIIAAVFLASVVLSSVCSGEQIVERDGYLTGEWTYLHDPQKTILSFEENGTAIYGSRTYTWSSTEEKITLIGPDDSEAVLPWQKNENGITIWLPSLFEKTDGPETGLVGSWKGYGQSGSSFVFASNGHFLEDGVFTGTYVTDEDAGVITLQYGGLFQDTKVYYSFMENILVICYPWEMTKK